MSGVSTLGSVFAKAGQRSMETFAREKIPNTAAKVQRWVAAKPQAPLQAASSGLPPKTPAYRTVIIWPS